MYSDAIGVMLMTHDRYHDFTKRPIGDARRHSQALPTLSVDNRDAVDATLTRAVAAGGSADPNPAQDRGFMFNRTAASKTPTAMSGRSFRCVWLHRASLCENRLLTGMRLTHGPQLGPSPALRPCDLCG